jgi:aminopeptidase N
MDPLGAVAAVRRLRRHLGAELAPLWRDTYDRAGADGAEYSPDPLSAGRRSLKNLALSYLMAAQPDECTTRAAGQYYNARNMTDRMGGLTTLVHYGSAQVRDEALNDFYERWQQDPLVMDKWFSLQATAPATTVAAVRALMLHPAFSLRNPNRARSLIFQFCMNNLQGVHNAEGYAFWTEQVLALDKLNPEIAARLARTFDNWARYASPYREALRKSLERIQQEETLSRNVSEIISKALNV